MGTDHGRCTAEHNPQVWPYVARCVRPERHAELGGDWAVRDVPSDPSTTRVATPAEHYDRHGQIWEG
jgi:hypothetical protein